MRDRAKALGIKVDGRWSEHRLLEEIMKTESKLKDGDMVGNARVERLPDDVPVVEGVDVVEDTIVDMMQDAFDGGGKVTVITDSHQDVLDKVADKFQTLEWANARAAAIWEGQSSSLTVLERIGRIKLALKAKGFEDFSNITIPTKIEYKKYL